MTIDLRLGDCLEVMKTLPDGSVDAVVTDPPYGIEYHSNYYKHGNPFAGIVGDGVYPIEAITMCRRLARKASFFFCRWESLRELDTPKSLLVWAKNNWTAGDLKHEFARAWEGILFYP